MQHYSSYESSGSVLVPSMIPEAMLFESNDYITTNVSSIASCSLHTQQDFGSGACGGDIREGVAVAPCDGIDDSMKKRNASRPRVCFNEELNVHVENNVYSKEDCREFWFSQNEYAQFKLFSTFIATSVIETAQRGYEINKAQSFIDLIIKGYEGCCLRDSITESDLKCLLTEQEELLITQIYAATGGAVLIGLERNIALMVGRDINKRRKEIVCAVQDVQERSDSTNWVSDDELAKEIGLTCEMLSRPSKRFARHMAIVHNNLWE